MKKDLQHFGGAWTQEKLRLLEKYLKAYTKILDNTPYRFAYIDAFAGTGYSRKAKILDNHSLTLKFGDDEQKLLDGSARIALGVKPLFNKYIFIEKDIRRYRELTKLKKEFPELSDRIAPTHRDANEYLLEICQKNWTKRRAVVFLDPFGMEVKWGTIEALGETQAIDLWLLFPLGQAINRLLRRDAKINSAIKSRLDDCFGTTGWYEHFYRIYQENALFGKQLKIRKIADFNSISTFFIERLRTVFADVSTNPRPLYNSRKSPLFLLCFAAGNKKGAPTAIKIADDILRKL